MWGVTIKFAQGVIPNGLVLRKRKGGEESQKRDHYILPITTGDERKDF